MGQPKEKRETKWISRAKRGSRTGQPKNEVKTNGLLGAKNKGWGRPT